MYSYAMSRDGKHAAYFTYDPAKKSTCLYLMDADGTHQQLLFEVAARIRYVKFSGNGTAMAGAIAYPSPNRNDPAEETCFYYELGTGHGGVLHEPTLEQRNSRSLFMDISADGRYLLYGMLPTLYGWSYGVYNSDFSRERKVLNGHYANVQFSPDGMNLLFTQDDNAYAMTLDTLAITPIPFVRPAGLSVDGRYLLYVQTPVE